MWQGCWIIDEMDALLPVLFEDFAGDEIANVTSYVGTTSTKIHTVTKLDIDGVVSVVSLFLLEKYCRCIGTHQGMYKIVEWRNPK